MYAPKLCLRVVLILAFAHSTVLALQPDELLLIANKNAPISLQLAEYYAKMRAVPPGRIVGLDLPGSEEIPFDKYEREVVPAIRAFLRANKLERKVKCLVTFYGVPIRVGSRINIDADNLERDGLKKELDGVIAEMGPLVVTSEKLALEIDPAFKGPQGTTLDDLARRADAAARTIGAGVARLPDEASRNAAVQKFLGLLQQFAGPLGVAQRVQPQKGHFATTQEARNWQSMQAQAGRVVAEVAGLQEQRFDSESRKKLRELVKPNLGLFNLARTLEAQVDYLTANESMSGFDSELAMLWIPTYLRAKWQFNPLHWRMQMSPVPPVLMTARLDGPEEGTARDIIIASLKAEREGLDGTVVIDSRNIPRLNKENKIDGYGDYDETLRHLNAILRTKTKLHVLFDDQPEILPANSAKNVALYCGWYRLRSYEPSMTFVPGAVGFHVASLEMVSLRGDKETGWCKGLLNDGIAATLGPVAEPYLHSFPRSDEFFPLLLTGRLTLAETYWKTQLLTSWMTNLIGDPLYTPYRKNPALNVEDLPFEMSRIFDAPTSRPLTDVPATQPATLP